MAKYKYIVKQAGRFDDPADDRKVIGMDYVVGHDMEGDWSSAQSAVEGDGEYNARVEGDPKDDSVDLNISGGQFTISDGVDTATVYLDGDEENLVDIMDKIDDAFISEAMSNIGVKAFTIEWSGENKSYLEIFSIGAPGTSDEITISTTTANLSQFGLSAGSTFGTKPDRIIVNKVYLGGVIISSEEIDNPEKPKISVDDKYTDELEDRVFRSIVIQDGHIEDEDVPLLVDKISHPYVETEFDEAVDGTAVVALVDGSIRHLYKVGSVCVDSTGGVCVDWRFENVETSADEKAAELDYIQKYEKKIDEGTNNLIKGWCIANVGNEEKAINLGIQKAITDDLSEEEETMWSDYQSYRATVIASQRSKKVEAMVKE